VRTALQIASDAYAELGLGTVSQIVGSTAADGSQILALLNRAGNEIANQEGGWPELRGEQIVTLIPGQQSYPFPSDLLAYRPSTGWDRTTHWRLLGPMSDREWQRIRSGIAVASPYQRYRIYGGQLQFDPVPTTADTIAFEYISKNWCTAADGTPQACFKADTDVPVIDADLILLSFKWRLLAARGFNYTEEKAAFAEALARRKAQSESAQPLALNRRNPRIGGLGLPPIPDGNWPGR